jgi:hypothetical protein
MARYGTDFRRWPPIDLRSWGRGGDRGLGGGGYNGDARRRGGSFLGGWGRGPARGQPSGFFRGRGQRGSWAGSYDYGYGRDVGHRLREGWRDMKRSAREWFRGGRYDRGW